MQDFRVIKNFFSKEEIRFIKKCSEEFLRTKKKFGSQLGYPEDDTSTTPSKEFNVYTITEEADLELYNIISNKIKKEFNKEIFYTQFYYLKGIPNVGWHYDCNKRCSGAATIYLNMNWDINFGGYFVYEKDQKFGIEMPEYNKCIFQDGLVHHAITSVSNNASYRKSLQVFFKK